MFWQRGLLDFLIVTVILGGAAAMMTGRAIAYGWRPMWIALAWMIPLTAAVRFIHFVLFKAPLLALDYYVLDLLVLAIAAGIGHRLTRARQMARGYPWMIRPSGPFAWRARPGADQ